MRPRYLILAAVTAVGVTAGAALGAVLFVSSGAIRPGAGGGVASIGGPFTLVDDTGAPVTERTLAGKPSVMYFGYTFCPEVCPTTLLDLSHWIQKLGPDADKLNYAFVTVDPQRDTPKSMHAYLSSFDKHIRGFTGTPEQIARIAKEYRVYYKRIPTEDGDYVMDHSSMIYLMGADGKFIGAIAYQENDASAVGKLRNLLATAASS
jgi:protein SCO1